MAGARFCSNCGQALDAPEARFCKFCGAPALAGAVPSAPPATVAPTSVPMPVAGTSARRFLVVAAIAVVVVATVGAVLALVFSGPGGFSGIRVLAPSGDCWSGAISGPGTMASVEGCGSKDYPLACGGSAMASLVKDDAGLWSLTVQIVSNGHVVRESSTATPYGGVSVVGTC